MKILKLSLRNFKGTKELTIEANGHDVNIYGDNETGKTTVMDALTWLLFGKDSENKSNFNIKTLDKNGEPMHHLEHEVEGVFQVNGRQLTLKKVFKENWTRKRGSNKESFSGHTTDYFVNEIPAKETEYSETIKSIAQEDLFKLLTNPLYFNRKLHWKDRREMLLKVCGDVSVDEVVSELPELKGLPDEVISQERTVEEHMKLVQSKMKKVNDRIKEIPIRISEVEKSMPDVTGINFAALCDEIQMLNGEIDRKKSELLSFTSGGAISEKKKQLEEIDAELLRIENEHTRNTQDNLNTLRKQYNNISNQKMELERSLRQKNNIIENKQANIDRLKKSIDELRKSFFDVNAETFSINCTCPTCGQSLPEEKIEEANKAFNLNKSNRLGSINTEGKKAKEELETLEKELPELAQDRDRILSEINNIQVQLDGLDTQIKKPSPSVTEILEYRSKAAQRAQVAAEIKDLKDGNKNEVEEIQKSINELSKEVNEKLTILSKKSQVENANTRIGQLRHEERNLASEYEKLENELFLCEQFIKTKVSILDKKINSFFKLARFKMFNQQINGGIDECCEVTYNGVPFSDLNNAARINIGLDIINTLSEYHGFYPPIFIDNAESVTKFIEVNTQVLRLIVSEPDKKLRVEVLNLELLTAVGV